MAIARVMAAVLGRARVDEPASYAVSVYGSRTRQGWAATTASYARYQHVDRDPAIVRCLSLEFGGAGALSAPWERLSQHRNVTIAPLSEVA